MLHLIHTIAISTTPIIKNRHYDRISKKPLKKFTVTDKSKGKKINK
jgi:hypothetical protein